MIKPRVCILLNHLDEFDFELALLHYLPADRYEVVVTETWPDDPSAYQMIVPWNYRKIIKQATQAGNVVVMHSSNLPEGRGWAPIYHAFIEQKAEYVISGIFAADEVDTGDVIVRARFPIEAGYTASFIRKIDEELSLVLISRIFEQWPNGNIVGAKQVGVGSYRHRRYPVDNEIALSQPLVEIFPHLRGMETENPAFFFHDGVKYLIEVRPEIKPHKPKRVIIEYSALNKVEFWNNWNDSP